MSAVPVLMYHHVAPDREVTAEGFAAQLKRLQERGWISLSSADFLAHLRGERPAPPRSLVITFDDGYADNWVYAFPALKRHGFAAQVFVVTDRVGRGAPRKTADAGGTISNTTADERGPAGFLTWEELREMAGSGVFEVGSHTRTHRGFKRENLYADLAEELASSRRAIEVEIGAWKGLLAWPWGDFEERWLSLLPAHGYALAYTTRAGANVPGADPLKVHRFKVRSGDPDWLEGRLRLHASPMLARAYGLLRKTFA